MLPNQIKFMGNNRPQRNHYVSEFHLAEFTNIGSKDGRLYVHDLFLKCTRPGTPKSVGYQKNINPPQAEKNFNEYFETPAAKVLKEISKTQNFPTTKEEIAYLFLFILFQAFRIPMVRNYEAGTDKNSLVNRLHYLAVTEPSTFPFWIEMLKGENIEIPNYDYSNTNVVNQVDWNNFEVKFPTQWHIDNLLDLMGVNLNSLFKLTWKMYIANTDADDFICTDKPVICLPKNNPLQMPRRLVIPDFGEDTIVAVPLTRRIALMGEFNDEENFRVFEVDNNLVATINGLLLSNPSYIRTHKGGNPIVRYIYSAKDDFVYLKIDSSIGKKKDFFATM